MHQIHYETADIDCDKKWIVAGLNEMCERESDWGGGLPSPINWTNLLFNSYDEAINYFENNYHSYEQIAVKYKDFPNLKPSKKYTDLEEKCRVACDKAYTLKSAFHFEDHSSAFVGCKKCNSKINRKYLKRNYCPICCNDLRPESTLKKITALEENVKKLQKELKAEEQKLQAKQSKSAVEKWLIKVEYHC